MTVLTAVLLFILWRSGLVFDLARKITNPKLKNNGSVSSLDPSGTVTGEL